MATHTHALKSFQLRNKTAGDLLLEFSNFGYMWTSVDTKKIVASHIVYSMLEIEPFTEFLTIKKWREFVHPHDLSKLIQAEEYVLITGESTSVEYRLITSRGKNLYVNHHMKLSNGVSGIKLMSIIEDITEQKRGDVILDIMNEGFFELDDNFCFRRLNKHAEKFWNIHLDDILGKKITDVFPDSQDTFFYKLIINAKSKKSNLIDEVVSPVRNTWIRISVSPYNDGVIVVFYDIDDKKRAEEELIRLKDELAKRATDRYYSLFNSINQGFCIIEMIWDKEGKPVDYRFLEVNATFENQIGIKNAAGKTMREIEPQHEEHWLRIFGEVAKTKKPVQFEEKAEFLTQGLYEMLAFPIEDHETKIGLLIYDITGRKRKEQHRIFLSTVAKELVEATEMQTGTMELLAEKIGQYFEVTWCTFGELSKDRETVTAYAWNTDGAVSLKGVYRMSDFLSKEQVSAHNDGELLIVSDTQTDPRVNADACGALGIRSFVIVSWTQDRQWGLQLALIHNTPRIFTQDEIDLLRELTSCIWSRLEKARVDDALRESEGQLKQFNAALEQKVLERTSELIKQNNILTQAEELAQAGSWEYNVSTDEFVWSDGMYRLFEMEKGQRVTPEIYLDYALRDDWPLAKKLVDTIRKNFEPIEEIIRIKLDHSYKTIQIKAAPFKNAKGGVEKMLGVDLDITITRQAAKKITELNRSLWAINREMNSLNTELKTFTGIAANDYSETLRHLYINLEMIVTNDARNLSNSGRANLRRAQGAIQKMKLTTDDLISFSRLHEIGSKENNLDLTNIVAKVVDDFRNQPGHSLVEINCDHLPSITGYPLLLFQMFHHLIDNAIKFRKSDKGHIVNITCKESVNGQETDREMIDKNVKYHVISVSDNGIGFPPAESEAIFQMFYRLHEKNKYKGSGIGLALCKRVMEMHGGFILAESRPDEGASFHCYFPAGDSQ